jgi:hypothetical protein
MSFNIPRSHSASTLSSSVPSAAQPTPKDFYVTILPNKVVILNINKLRRTELFQPMLEMTMMSPKVSSTHFFSITSTDEELSLVTDEELLTNVIKQAKIDPLSDYNTFKTTHRVLQFHEGMSGVSHTGVVEYLSKLFSIHSIPIIYINTFNNNFILIASSDFEKCKTILKKYNYV